MHALGFKALIPTRTLILFAVGFSMLAAGCGKKQVRATPPVLVPSIEVQPQPTPPADTTPVQNPNPSPEAAPVDNHQQDAQKPKPKPRRPIRKPTPPVAETPKQEPAKPSAPDSSVQITADIPRAAVQTQKQNTEQLLRNSENKLGHINRNLSESEQGMLRQARNYITQSHQALQGADVERAYNLAVKASLLANELTK